jgi:hypothetical protein
MPRLSMYKPEKGNDFRFIDRVINEEFQVGGTDVYIHKYLGPVNPEEGNSTPTQPNNSNPIPELGIQDVLFMENRDRHYDPDVYVIRGIYTMQDLDFNLSQFGLFLQNDNIMINFHLRSSFDALGRKIMAGDVIELPHQKDEYALDDSLVALRRFYVVSEVTRPASGYSQTWYPHLVRAKCSPLVDSQEFKEILDADSGAEDGSTLRDLMSSYKKNIEINNQIIQQAQADVEKSGYQTDQFYIVPVGNTGTVSVADASIDNTDVTSGSSYLDASAVLNTPSKNYYIGYLTGDGIPPNGIPYGFGIIFPSTPALGDFFLRTDYLPNRLFRYDGVHWIKYEDNVRMTTSTLGQTQTDNPLLVRRKLKASFVNNTTTGTISGVVISERQALSQVLKPRADL